MTDYVSRGVAGKVRKSKRHVDAPYALKDSCVGNANSEPALEDVDIVLAPVTLCEKPGEFMEDDEGELRKTTTPDAEKPCDFAEVNSTLMEVSSFPKVAAQEEVQRRLGASSGGGVSASFIRRLMVPPHRLSPLRKHWEEIVQPLVQHMKLLVRMNVKRRCVELKMSPKTPEVAYLQKGADFVRSFLLGFDIQDGLALLRLDDLFLESFEIKDVKRLVGDHLSRCIGRISGKEGKTKFAVENATRTRIVLADSHIHILGGFQNIKLARDSICALILGSPAGKVYNRLRIVSRRLQERL